MSFDLTFRQKLIRIACSASVCGLSFSFVIGEVVDREAKQLRSWAVDPALIPVNYLPTQPVLAAMSRFDNPAWRENLVAVNNLAPAPSPIALSPEPTLAAADAVKTKSASVAKAPQASSVYIEPSLPMAEVEKLLYSIHSATTKLMATPAMAGTPAEISAPVKPKLMEPVAPLAQRTPTSPAPKPALRQEIGSTGVWFLNGRILSTTSHDTEAGHYEVGFYSKIDSEERPVGPPSPKQILPEGQTSFRLEIPAHVERGYLFAEFVSAKTGKPTLIMPSVNPWVRGNREVAELFFRTEDKVSTIAAARVAPEVSRNAWRVQGTVTTMFVKGSAKIPQADVVVKVRGRKEAARTDRNGAFSIELPRMKGTLFLEVLKMGYQPSIITVNADETRPLKIEIASRHAIEQISQRLGTSQGNTRGIFVGQVVNPDGSGVRGMTAQLSIKADGPFYFDENGVTNRDLKATSGNGGFLFLNVESGTGFLETSVNSEGVAPLQVSTVDGGELIQKTLVLNSGNLGGRIFNPVEAGGKPMPVSGARVRIDGASEWVTTDAFGAFSIGPFKWFKGEKITLEVSAEKYNNHRYVVSADGPSRPLNLFAFPAAYVNRLARSMDIDLDPYAGLIIGKVSGPGMRMDALADHSLTNNAKDYYFDARGRLRGSHAMTDPKFGTYIVFNVPKGRTLLQGNDATGTLRYSEAVVATPSSINIQME